MPRSRSYKSSRLKASAFCIAIYLCSFLVVSHYTSKSHPRQFSAGVINHPGFVFGRSAHAQAWYLKYCRNAAKEQGNETHILREKLHANPSDAYLHFQIAEILNQENGKEAQSLAHFRKAIHLQPQNTLYHLTFGAVLQQHGLEKAALTQFQSAANSRTHPLSAQYEVGCILCRQGRQQEGIALLTKMTNCSDRYWSFAAASHLREIRQPSMHA